MTKLTRIITFLILFCCTAQSMAQVDICFSPEQPCLNEIAQKIDQAKHTVYILSYSFHYQPIIQALVGAIKRGVKVSVIVDHAKSLKKKTHKTMALLQSSGAKVYIFNSNQKQHNKVMIIDDNLVITGSLNFSDSSKIQNNVIFLSGKAYADQYTNYFNQLIRDANYKKTGN